MLTTTTTFTIDDIPVETNYRGIVEHAIEGIFQTTPDGRYLLANPALASIYGYESVDELKSSVKEIARQLYVDPARRAEFIHLMDKHDSVWDFESQIFRKDGSIIWISENVRVIRNDSDEVLYYEGTVEDITERKRAMAQIEEQAALLDKAQDAIKVRDLQGRILFWNKGAERIYGWTREEAMSSHVSRLISTETAKEERAYTALLKDGEWSGELQQTARDGRKLTVEARWTLLRDDDGNPKSIFAITTDITDRKKIEAQFLRAQRMESIGTLAGGVAHDLNNILSPIMMSIGMLKKKTVDPQSIAILNAIEVSSQRGADIVRQILSFARGLDGKRIEVQPKHLLKDIENIIKSTFPKNIRLELSTPHDTWTVLGDPTQLHQILLNLCVNARDAMPQGGHLSIHAENRVLDEHYTAMNIQAKPGPHVIINVVDSGTGMTPEVMDKIFDPFYTTKEIGKGTGLGLSTVMAIVKSHEGFINVYSEPEKGTTFRLHLPTVTSHQPGGEPEVEVSLPRGNGETILMIDDETSILTIASQTLEAFGYRVLTADNGAAGVAIYAQRQNQISLVLTDMAMPVMDGRATIHTLKQINPAVKIIAASGLNANANISISAGAGARHFLPKPYSSETLLKMLRMVLDEA
jgi:PAS domain S-box-containing protein